jgi:hypothetical protein
VAALVGAVRSRLNLPAAPRANRAERIAPVDIICGFATSAVRRRRRSHAASQTFRTSIHVIIGERLDRIERDCRIAELETEAVLAAHPEALE